MAGATTTAEIQIDAMNAAFLAHWIAAGELAANIAWDTEDFDTSAVTDFVRFGYNHETGEHAALGAGNSRFIRRFAIITAVIYVRKGELASRRLALVEVVMDFLETVDVAGISVENPGAQDNGVVNGWNQVNCTAESHYDLIRTA